jgi:hypothetical protein
MRSAPELTVDGIAYVFAIGPYAGMMRIECADRLLLRSTVVAGGRRYSVTQFQDQAFSWCSLTHLFIPKTIESLPFHAFTSCHKIGAFAFECESRLTEISAEAFYNSGLITIHIPSGVTTIGKKAFFMCRFLSSVTFAPECRITELNDEVFSKSGLDAISIPRSVQAIGVGAFCESRGLCTVEFEPGSALAHIKGEAFSLTAVSRITIPGGVQMIDGSAFEWPKEVRLTNTDFFSVEQSMILNASRTVVIIAFGSPARVNIPDSVRIIGHGSFRRNMSLKTLGFGPASRLSVFGEAALYGSGVEWLCIPRTTEVLGRDCFGWCERLRRVDFDCDSICRRIEDSAFAHTAIGWIRLPSTVEAVGRTCFAGCKLLTDIACDANSKLTQLGDQAFTGANVSAFEIPSSLVRIDGVSLEGLKMVSLEEGHSLEFDGEFLLADDGKRLVRGFTQDEDVFVPAGVEVLGRGCFSRNYSVKNVYFDPGSQLKKIEEFAFRGLALEALELPEGNCVVVSPRAFQN